ncbi:MAG: YSC84-related protein [Candidatus Polarisedimenticolia bacterium]
MRNLRVLGTLVLALAALALPARVLAEAAKAEASAKAEEAKKEEKKEATAEEKRAKLDEIAQATMEKLFTKSEDARELYNRSYGYAVFDNSKVSFGITGGGGAGVAVPREGGTRTYMKMGSGGVGVGIGYQEYQVVFLFEDKEHFDRFVNEGWSADASASAVGGKAGASAAGAFSNGIALFKLDPKGLALQADVTGTKYWKDKKLNSE